LQILLFQQKYDVTRLQKSAGH